MNQQKTPPHFRLRNGYYYMAGRWEDQYPFVQSPGEAAPGGLIATCDYDDEIKAMLLHGSALNWLNLEKSIFS